MPDGLDTHTRDLSNLDFHNGGEREIDNGSDGNLLASDVVQGT